MAEITIARLQQRIARDRRQWGEPFESQKKTVAYIVADPRLRVCPKCEGERGYITILGLYVGCARCGGRGVVRRHWWWFHVPLPLSFYEES